MEVISVESRLLWDACLVVDNSDPVVKNIGSELELDIDCGSIEDSVQERNIICCNVLHYSYDDPNPFLAYSSNLIPNPTLNLR